LSRLDATSEFHFDILSTWQLHHFGSNFNATIGAVRGLKKMVLRVAIILGDFCAGAVALCTRRGRESITTSIPQDRSLSRYG
jgi:hypothetical protein